MEVSHCLGSTAQRGKCAFVVQKLTCVGEVHEWGVSAQLLRHIKEPHRVLTIGSPNRGLDSNYPRKSEMGRVKRAPVGIRHRPHERDRTGAAPSACKSRRSANSIPSATTICSSSRSPGRHARRWPTRELVDTDGSSWPLRFHIASSLAPRLLERRQVRDGFVRFCSL